MHFFLLYIDPGSGSYILQLIIAAVLGISIFFKNFWLSIKAFIFGKKPKDKEENDATE
ncbi:MAG: hypothetical protein IPL84_02435 [Chitinophagaceae bacterium]|nr:hypothetical protein [Chitinophagaceae bacterium]